MPDAKGIRIQDFPPGKSLWRVDWMGDIHKNPLVQSEHLITVFLTKLNCSGDTSFFPLNNKFLDTDSRRIAEIGVGLLPLVWIGSVWQNGRRFDDGVKYDNRTVSVDTTFVKTITFSETSELNSSDRLIPAHQYPLGGNAWGSVRSAPLFALPYLGDPYGLLIPAIEVIRFYYIHSSSSACALFFGQYDRLFSNPECNLEMPLPPVKLTPRWGARHEDAWVLARYIASEHFKKRALKIYNWVTLNIEKNAQPKSKPSESFFPFEGKTNLKFDGIQIRGDDGKVRFLVTRLRNCSHPMPYSDVTIRIPDKSSQPGGDEELRPIWYKTWPKGLDLASLPFKKDQEPDKNMAILYLEENEARFAALKGRKLNKEKMPPKQKEHIRKPIDSDEEKNGLGTSEGTHGKSDTIQAKARQDLVPDDDSAPMTLINFINALVYLRTEGFEVSTIAVGENVSKFKGEIISFFETLATKKKQWGMIQVKPQKSRGLIVAEVIHRERYAYIFEIERDPTRSNDQYSVLVISSPFHTIIQTTELQLLMKECQSKGGWPEAKSLSRQYNRASTPHLRSKKISVTTTDTENLDDPEDPNMGKRILNALRRVEFVT